MRRGKIEGIKRYEQMIQNSYKYRHMYPQKNIWNNSFLSTIIVRLRKFYKSIEKNSKSSFQDRNSWSAERICHTNREKCWRISLIQEDGKFATFILTTERYITSTCHDFLRLLDRSRIKFCKSNLSFRGTARDLSVQTIRTNSFAWQGLVRASMTKSKM